MARSKSWTCKVCLEDFFFYHQDRVRINFCLFHSLPCRDYLLCKVFLQLADGLDHLFNVSQLNYLTLASRQPHAESMHMNQYCELDGYVTFTEFLLDIIYKPVQFVIVIILTAEVLEVNEEDHLSIREHQIHILRSKMEP